MRKILFYIFAAIFLCSLCTVINKYVEQKKDEAFYDSLRAETTNQKSSNLISENAEKGEGNEEKAYQMPAQLKNLADNENVVGWIKIDGTNIDYPIAQSKIDNEYFLHRDILGNKNSVGSIYLDSANDIDEVGIHLIYGHHMRNGTMFHDVSNFTDNQYLEIHKDITIWTKQRKIRLSPIYCYTGAADGSYRQNFYSSEELQKFIKEKTGISITAENVFIFITCAYGSNDERTYLICQ